MSVKDIVSLVMLGIALLFVGLGILKNRKNHWIYAVSRVAVVVVSIVLGVLISNLVGGVLASTLFDIIKNSGALDDMSDLMTELPSLEEAFRGIIGCVFALFLFVIIFLILKAILNGIAKPIARKIIVSKDLAHTAAYEPAEEKTEQAETAQAAEADEAAEAAETAEEAEAAPTAETAEKTEEPKPKLKGKAKKRFKKKALRTPKANLYGMLGGAIGCLLVWVALFAPLVGTVTLLDDGLSILEGMDEADESMEVVMEIADAAANNVGSKAVTYLGGKPIFVGLTTCQVGGHSMSLNNEVRFLSVTGDALLYMSDDNPDKDAVAEKLRAAGAAFSKTDFLPVLIPEFCHAAADDWKAGRDFMGIEKPEMEGVMEVFLNPFVDIMAESNYDTVKEDVNTLLELVAEVVEADALARIEKNPVMLFEDKEFSSGMLETLLKNDRMSGMVGGFLQFGVQAMGESFDMYENGDEIYNLLVNDLRKATNEFDGSDVSDLADEYKAILDSYGLNLGENAAMELAFGVATSASEYGQIGNNQIEAVIAATDLADAEGNPVRLSKDNIVNYTVLKLLGGMKFDSTDISDAKAEATALSNALAAVAEMVGSMDSEEFMAADSISKLGNVMDHLAATKTVGADNVANIVIGMVQSKEFASSMGISVLEATEIAEAIVEGAEKQSYAKLMASIGETIRVLESVNSDKPLADTVSDLMKTLDANSAKVLKSMAKPSVMIANGVPEENAEASANLMSSMFGNLAEMGEDMSEEDFERETNAVKNMTNLAMNMNVSGDGDTFGENGALGVTAEEFVTDILGSRVMTKTMRDTVYDENGEAEVDPMGSEISLNDQEKAEVLDAMNECWLAEEDTASEEIRQNYVALGAMLNMELVVTDSGIQG